MQIKENNFSFIDSQNLYRGIARAGWKLDFKKFRIYLKDKYSVSTAYVFIGYTNDNQDLYASLQKAGYILIFKPTIPNEQGDLKGNIDADLVLQAMLDYKNYDGAVIVSSDGDFYSLVRYLYKNKKLKKVLSPYTKTCSSLLKKEAKEKIVYMDNLIKKLGYKKKNTA